MNYNTIRPHQTISMLQNTKYAHIAIDCCIDGLNIADIIGLFAEYGQEYYRFDNMMRRFRQCDLSLIDINEMRWYLRHRVPQDELRNCILLLALSMIDECEYERGGVC